MSEVGRVKLALGARLDRASIRGRYAEDNNGLLYLSGAGWDTITAHAPIEGAPANVLTVVQGSLVVRLLLDATETDRDHKFAVTLMGEDGDTIGKIEGGVRVARIRGLPLGWPQNVNIVIPMTGIDLPRAGLYNIGVQVNEQHVGDRPFRVLKGY